MTRLGSTPPAGSAVTRLGGAAGSDPSVSVTLSTASGEIDSVASLAPGSLALDAVLSTRGGPTLSLRDHDGFNDSDAASLVFEMRLHKELGMQGLTAPTARVLALDACAAVGGLQHAVHARLYAVKPCGP